MDKKKLAMALGALSVGVSGQALADNPFQTVSMERAYNTNVVPVKIAEQVCGGKNQDAACNSKAIKKEECVTVDADYQEFKAFKQSKYYDEFKNSESYKNYKAEQAGSQPATTQSSPPPKTKSSSCSAGGCGGG